MSNRIADTVKDYFDDQNVIVHRSCNPNRLGDIALCSLGDDWMVYHHVIDPESDWSNDEVVVYDYDCRECAEASYETIMKEQQETPNWELQREYDSIWGENVNVYHFEY